MLLAKDDIYTYVANEILSLKTEVPHFKDWAVLVKDRFEAAEMQRVLGTVGIPSTCRGKEPLSETLAFQAVYELLEALAKASPPRTRKMCISRSLSESLSSDEIQALESSPFVNDRALIRRKRTQPFLSGILAQHPMPIRQVSFHLIVGKCWNSSSNGNKGGWDFRLMRWRLSLF